MSAATQPLPAAAPKSQSSSGRAFAYVAAALIVLATALIFEAASWGHESDVPEQPRISGWIGGFTGKLTYDVFLLSLLVFTLAYATLSAFALRLPRLALSPRAVIWLLVVLYTIVLLGPVLISTDVFSYIAYARMGAIHGINPYEHGPHAIWYDHIYHFVGKDWIYSPTAYGPLYTLLTYPFAYLGIDGTIWSMKLIALGSTAGILWATWRIAERRGFDGAAAALIVGVNPIYLLYGAGGAHNDLLMMFLMMGAVALVVAPRVTAGREATAGAALVAGALIKVTAGAVLPFMVLSRRKMPAVLGALAMAIVGVIVADAVFGIKGVDIFAALSRDSSFVSTDSFATEFAHLIGKPGVFPIDHDLLKGVLVVVLAYLVWRTWRGYEWIAASGWALLAISVTTTWLLAWYILWPLPLAVVSKDRRLLAAVLLVQLVYVIHQYSPLLVPVQ
jgi:alpha-1,6-mannosyltransferase